MSHLTLRLFGLSIMIQFAYRTLTKVQKLPF